MTKYAWVGRSRTGRVVRGTRTAESPAALTEALRRERILPTRVRPAGARGRRRGAPTARELAVFTRQLAVMTEAGLPLVQCLHLLSRESPDGPLSPVIDAVRTDIEHGASLAAALERRGGTFSRLYVSMVAAGEAGGVLDVVLKRLAAFLETEAKLKAAVRSAMAYPLAILGIAVVVVLVILWQVVPTFTALFEGLDATLPLPTRMVIEASRALPAGMPALVGAAGLLAWAGRRWRSRPRGRLWLDGLTLKLPALGAIVRKVCVARVCRTLSSLVGAGVPILAALDITSRSAGNAVVERGVQEVRRRVERGDTMARSLQGEAIFPGMVVQMIGVGETTGALDGMLARVADFYEAEVEVDVARALALLEPALISVLGVIVGGIVISLYLPLVELVGQLS